MECFYCSRQSLQSYMLDMGDCHTCTRCSHTAVDSLYSPEVSCLSRENLHSKKSENGISEIVERFSLGRDIEREACLEYFFIKQIHKNSSFSNDYYKAHVIHACSIRLGFALDLSELCSYLSIPTPKFIRFRQFISAKTSIPSMTAKTECEHLLNRLGVKNQKVQSVILQTVQTIYNKYDYNLKTVTICTVCNFEKKFKKRSCLRLYCEILAVDIENVRKCYNKIFNESERMKKI